MTLQPGGGQGVNRPAARPAGGNRGCVKRAPISASGYALRSDRGNNPNNSYAELCNQALERPFAHGLMGRFVSQIEVKGRDGDEPFVSGIEIGIALPGPFGVAAADLSPMRLAPDAED